MCAETADSGLQIVAVHKWPAGFGWGIALCELHVGQILWVNLCHHFVCIIPLVNQVVKQHARRVQITDGQLLFRGASWGKDARAEKITLWNPIAGAKWSQGFATQ